jgi:hypothetical protein
MLTTNPSVPIYLHSEPIDMRKSFDGLFGIIKSDLNREPVVAPSGLKPNSREQARGEREQPNSRKTLVRSSAGIK